MKTHVKIAVAITLIFAIVACSIFTPTTANQPSIQNEDSQNQVSAGFTDDEELPFIILHQNGEQLAVTQDFNSKEKTGIVWVSPEGDSVVIFADKDGNPKGAVVGDDILLYSNFTENTVDITILHPDGSSEVFSNLEIDTTLINKVKSKSSSPYNLASFSNQNLLLQTQDDFWNFWDNVFIVVGFASCLSAFILGAGAGAAAGGAPSGGVGAVPGATAGAIATFAILVGLCGSVIVDTVIKTADAYNIDILPLKTASFIKDLNDCQKRKLLDWIACGKTLTTILKTMREVAEERVTNNSEGKVIFEIQANSQSTQPPDCAQLNLTPEECANYGQHTYQSKSCTINASEGWKCGCDLFVEEGYIQELNHSAEFFSGLSDWKKVSPNTYSFQQTGGMGTETQTRIFNENGLSYVSNIVGTDGGGCERITELIIK